ncbi:hypothetical protein [Halorussus sp. MSC15.2]|uniref:hypothetical protein n=1 Tax=Halorussus sp. MSC15.2 TaxID=2283638 RepID=UPI0013D0113B|nr:hypothetical protein [Halorussus sp. MSC15.2]NEU56746.1 hypothetical protein [Halorussus sp. MSC15.2]
MKRWKKVLLAIIAGPALMTVGFVVGGALWTGLVNVLGSVAPSVTGLKSFGIVPAVLGALGLPYLVFADDSDD